MFSLEQQVACFGERSEAQSALPARQRPREGGHDDDLGMAGHGFKGQTCTSESSSERHR